LVIIGNPTYAILVLKHPRINEPLCALIFIKPLQAQARIQVKTVVIIIPVTLARLKTLSNSNWTMLKKISAGKPKKYNNLFITFILSCVRKFFLLSRYPSPITPKMGKIIFIINIML